MLAQKPSGLTKAQHFSYSDRAMQALQKRREELNLTQDELAAQLGVKGMTVSRWERGESLPRRKVWPKLQEITGVPIADLITEVSEKAESAA